MLVTRYGPGGQTRVLIDTSPDMRQQLLDAGTGLLDGVVFTHAHADHLHGLDDLRQIVFNLRRRLAVWADAPTQDALMARFGYAFVQAEGSDYPAICDLHTIAGPVTIDGAGGPVTLHPLPVTHGSIEALGFRIGPLAYMPDVSAIPESVWPLLGGLQCWVLDALRRKPHPTHVHLARALEWIARAAPDTAVLTNLHNDMDFATLTAELPPHIRPAHDGLVLHFKD